MQGGADMAQQQTATPRSILVIGAGVIGSVYAAWLSEAGQQVTILARGQRLAELRDEGLRLEDAATGQASRTCIATTDHLSPLDAYDLAMVAVRLDQVQDVLPVLAAAEQIPTVLFFLNNAFAVERYAQAVGRGRVVLGFPGIGGRRDGATIRYYVLPQQPTTLGDVTGSLTPRLRMLAGLFRSTGHRVGLTTRMDAWLKTHAVFVTCMAAAVDQCAGDSVRLANDRQRVATMVHAIREGFRALRASGYTVTPPNLAVLFEWMPRWFAVAYWQRALRGPVGTLAIAPHARAARGEMAELAKQVLDIVRTATVPTPTLQALLGTLVPPSDTPAASVPAPVEAARGGVR
jgi:2-dehydropantoate 2-reductase